jgi:hypothetical protein
MSLYWYSLTQYVVATSLSVPIDGADWVVALGMCLVRNVWVKPGWLKLIRHFSGCVKASGNYWKALQWSSGLTSKEVWMCLAVIAEWRFFSRRRVRTCTTSVECKIVMTVMLMVMSGMDSHMISWNLRSGLVKSCILVCWNGFY